MERKDTVNLWKAFCKSRIALAMQFDATDSVVNKWHNRLDDKLYSYENILKYVKENITSEGHVLDDPF